MLGIFDSGIGGLTVVRELLRRSPTIPFVYLGDTARTPYGNKSSSVVQQFACDDVQFLLDHGATNIVVACNTVSALAIDVLRHKYSSVRFFDVISPAVEAAISSHATRIGIIGTRATISSGVYERRIHETDPTATIYSASCPLLVPLVEEGWQRYPETRRIIKRYLAPLRNKQISTLILGCTHYPLLQAVIKSSLQRRVRIIDSPSALLNQIERQSPEILKHEEGGQSYYFTDPSSHTDAIASKWLGRVIRGIPAHIG